MNELMDSGLILSLTVFFPAIGALFIIFFLKSKTPSFVHQTAIAIGFIELILSVLICFGYDFNKGGLQFSHVYGPWIDALNAKYSIGNSKSFN